MSHLLDTKVSFFNHLPWRCAPVTQMASRVAKSLPSTQRSLMAWAMMLWLYQSLSHIYRSPGHKTMLFLKISKHNELHRVIEKNTNNIALVYSGFLYQSLRHQSHLFLTTPALTLCYYSGSDTLLLPQLWHFVTTPALTLCYYPCSDTLLLPQLWHFVTMPALTLCYYPGFDTLLLPLLWHFVTTPALTLCYYPCSDTCWLHISSTHLFVPITVAANVFAEWLAK
jgi:hypothetical protein